MARKTGRDTKIEIELGTTYYPLGALSTVSSPTADVGKVYTTNATYMSDQDELQPIVRLDGVISGFGLTPGSGYNEVDVASGSVYIQGSQVDVTATSVTGLTRPLISGNVKVSALSVDSTGTINTTAGTEGASSTTRGAAGGKPFIPANEVLLGYITMTYYTGSASGLRVITSGEIDDESKERTTIPSYKIIYHDGSGDNATNVGTIEFATALPLIHGAGVGTARRNVHASYYDATFEELNEGYDFSFDEDVDTIKSRAYGETFEESALSVESWSGSGNAYWSKVNDILSLIKNTKRWMKIYPDSDETAYFTGRSIIKIGRSLPLGDNLMATITFEGSGELYYKVS